MIAPIRRPGFRLLPGTTNRWVKKEKHRAGKKAAEAARSGDPHAYGRKLRYRQAINRGLDHETATRLSKIQGNISPEIDSALLVLTNHPRRRTGFEHITWEMIRESREELERHHASLTAEQIADASRPFPCAPHLTSLSFEAVFGRH